MSSDASPVTASGLSPMGEMARKMLPNTDNGLEVRKLLLTPEQASKLVAALDARQEEQDAIPADVLKRLSQNGWRFARIPAPDVEAIVTDLGQMTVDVREWHGQAPDWRPLQERTIGPKPRAVAIDGRIRSYDRGAFALMIRSWTVQTENGPFMYMEALPWYHGPRSTDLRRLLGDSPASSGQALGSMAMDLMLDADFGYVLLAASPAQEAVAQAGDSSATVNRKKPMIGPSGDDEAENALTMTIGEFLMTTERKPPMRVVFVFTPRIAAELDPTGVAANQKGGNRG